MQRSQLVAYVRLGALLTYKTDRLAEAMDAYAHASAAITALLNKEPLNVDIRRIKAYTLLDEAYALTWLGRAEDALLGDSKPSR